MRLLELIWQCKRCGGKLQMRLEVLGGAGAEGGFLRIRREGAQRGWEGGLAAEEGSVCGYVGGWWKW